jgi:hypothetical protein
MIANIHDDGEPSFRSRQNRQVLPHYHGRDGFPDHYEDEDAMFRRLGRDITPSEIWIRNDRGLYDVLENPSWSIMGGTLCQIGVHLVPHHGRWDGRFCQIVSGPHRGVRFAFKAEQFFSPAYQEG